jgi:hypothetical protein
MTTQTATAPLPNGAIPVTITTPERSWTMLGEPVGEHLAITPDFAVRPLFGARGPDQGVWSGRWMIFHLPTGTRLLPYGLCLKHARQAANELDACGVDWSRPRDVLICDPAVREALRPYGEGDSPTCTSMCRPRR